MVAAGVPKLKNRPDCIHLGAAGHVLGTGQTLRDEFTAYVPSRPHLEWQLRKRVHGLDNVTIVRRSVAEPRFDPARQRVTGALVDPADPDGGEPEFVGADLVVDAAGRGTRLPVWLAQWGFARPAEQAVDIGINYATQQFRIPDGLIAEKVVVAGASHDESLGLGMLCYEDGTWVLTTFGVADVKPPRTFPRCWVWPSNCCRAASAWRWHGPSCWAIPPSTRSRPAGGAATTNWSASPAASSPSATRWPASIPPSARA